MPEDPRVDPKKPEHVGLALGFGIVLTPCAVVELSEDPRGGLTRVALPFLSMGNMSDSNKGQEAVEPMLRALGVVVWHLASAMCPEKLARCELTTIAHKMEIKEDHGALWFNKACPSSRLATCILDPARKRGKKKQWYVYLGGGAIDVDQSELLAGGVVLCKDWAWARLTLLAAWLLLCTCPCGTPDLCDPRLIFTAHDDEGVKEAENPLLDDEEEKEKDEGLLGTASPDQGLLDDGDANLDGLLAEYEVAEKEVQMSEHGDTASGARDRQRFVRSCVRMQAIFLQEHLPSWPWLPGAQERMDPGSRAEKGHQSAEAFREWMGSYRTAEAAR